VKNLGDVGEALEKVVAAKKRGKTTVLEMLVTKELGDPFRRDALKIPRRLLKKYEHANVA
jgi:sulfoacetaldehyde acetyltransferase